MYFPDENIPLGGVKIRNEAIGGSVWVPTEKLNKYFVPQ